MMSFLELLVLLGRQSCQCGFHTEWLQTIERLRCNGAIDPHAAEGNAVAAAAAASPLKPDGTLLHPTAAFPSELIKKALLVVAPAGYPSPRKLCACTEVGTAIANVSNVADVNIATCMSYFPMY